MSNSGSLEDKVGELTGEAEHMENMLIFVIFQTLKPNNKYEK